MDIYNNKIMNVDEFNTYIIKNKEFFIEYCECLIFDDGNIMMAVPSHEMALMKYMIHKECPEKINGDPYMICNELIPYGCSPLHYIADKYNIVVVWYNSILIPTEINVMQWGVISKLRSSGAILPIIQIGSIIENHEYQNYKIRNA